MYNALMNDLEATNPSLAKLYRQNMAKEFVCSAVGTHEMFPPFYTEERIRLNAEKNALQKQLQENDLQVTQVTLAAAKQRDEMKNKFNKDLEKQKKNVRSTENKLAAAIKANSEANKELEQEKTQNHKTGKTLKEKQKQIDSLKLQLSEMTKKKQKFEEKLLTEQKKNKTPKSCQECPKLEDKLKGMKHLLNESFAKNTDLELEVNQLKSSSTIAPVEAGENSGSLKTKLERSEETVKKLQNDVLLIVSSATPLLNLVARHQVGECTVFYSNC